ncbi:MAG TPA: hypothetical protein VFQ87_11615 [Bradyrhizobium sp.]|jgi:hypothetical protein|nr:hypothetical protein [Bradyrhizobium sp.]
MRPATDPSNQNAPLRLIEPDLAAWAEKIAVDSTRKPRIWYGAALFWLVVTCIIAARVMFLDVSNFRPAIANTAAPSVLAGSAPAASHDAKL